MANLVFGSILVAFGVSLILKAILGIDIPLLRVLVGLLIIYWGITVLANRSWIHTGYRSKNYPHHHMRIKNNTHAYSVVFASNTIDLRAQTFHQRPEHIKVDAVFGNATIILPDNISVAIRSDAVFGSVNLSESVQAIITHETQKPELILHVSAVFGSIDINSL